MTRRVPAYQQAAPVVLSRAEADAVEWLRCAGARGVREDFLGPGIARRLVALRLARVVDGVVTGL